MLKNCQSRAFIFHVHSARIDPPTFVLRSAFFFIVEALINAKHYFAGANEQTAGFGRSESAKKKGAKKKSESNVRSSEIQFAAVFRVGLTESASARVAPPDIQRVPLFSFIALLSVFFFFFFLPSVRLSHLHPLGLS